MNVFGCADGKDYPPQVMRSDYHQGRLRKNAAKKSYDEFTQHKNNKQTDCYEIKSCSPPPSQPSSPTSLTPPLDYQVNNILDTRVMY